MNLLVTVIVLVDDISAEEVERVIANGIATDRASNTIKARPPTNEERQRQLMGNSHASASRLLKMISISK